MRCCLSTVFALAISLSAGHALGQDDAQTKRDIGGGYVISVPSSWTFASFPMPMKGASNVRLSGEGIKIAVTGFPTSGGMPEPRALEMGFTQGLFAYLDHVKDINFLKQKFEGKDLWGMFAELETKSGKPDFEVFPGEKFACVVPVTIGTKKMVFSVTIACESPATDSYKAALNAIKGISK